MEVAAIEISGSHLENNLQGAGPGSGQDSATPEAVHHSAEFAPQDGFARDERGGWMQHVSLVVAAAGISSMQVESAQQGNGQAGERDGQQGRAAAGLAAASVRPKTEPP